MCVVFYSTLTVLFSQNVLATLTGTILMSYFINLKSSHKNPLNDVKWLDKQHICCSHKQQFVCVCVCVCVCVFMNIAAFLFHLQKSFSG